MTKRTQKFLQFFQNQKGNVAILTAISATVLVGAAGSAIDYVSAGQLRTELNGAADAAVLSALKSAENALALNKFGWKKIGEKDGQTMFADNWNLNPRLSVKPAKISIVKRGGNLKATLEYTANYRTALVSILGIKSIALKNTVTAISGTTDFIDVHLVVDGSQSMGIGATLVDQNRMIAKNGCAFACHYADATGWGNTLASVRSIGAKLRIDVVREAAVQFIKDAAAREFETDQIRVSLHIMSNQLQTILPSTVDLTAASASANKIELVNTNLNGGTNIKNSLKTLTASLPKSGDGTSSSNRKSFIILLTDGVEDSQSFTSIAGSLGRFNFTPDKSFVKNSENYKWDSDKYQVQSFDASTCLALKSQGHTVLTAGIDYLIPPGTSGELKTRFNYIDKTLKPLKKAALRDCASNPSFSLNASDSIEIKPMFDRLLNIVMSSAVVRLSQ